MVANAKRWSGDSWRKVFADRLYSGVGSNDDEDGVKLTTVTLVFFFFMRRTREAIWMVKRVSEKSLGEAEM